MTSPTTTPNGSAGGLQVQYTMKPSELIVALIACIRDCYNVLIVGPPGVGKTDIGMQACAACDALEIESHPVVEDPTVAGGLPWMDTDADCAVFKPFGNLHTALNAKKRTVWRLEDLGQALPATQASYMQLLLAGRINGHILPRDKKDKPIVTFVATTNRRIDRAAVAGILEPVKSRFLTIIHLEPDVDDWCKWALKHDVEPVLIAFIQLRGVDMLCNFQPSADMTNSPVPRTWANVDKILKLDLPSAIEHKMIVGAVGETAAGEFSAFRELYKQIPNINAILANPDTADIPTSPDLLYALMSALVYKTNEQNFEQVAKYAERLEQEQHGEVAAYYLATVTQRVPEVQHTPAFVRVTTGPLGDLIAGTYDA